jgi:hypothetical protein
VIAAFLRVVLFGFAFLFLMVNVHEIGHTVFARMLGDDSAHYVLYQQQGTSTCMGCNLYDSSQLGNVANVFVNLGGVISTQLLCWTAVLLLARGKRNIPRWMLLSAIAFTWALDLILQFVQGLQANVPQDLPRGPDSTYTDYLAVVWFMRNETGADASDLKLGLLIGTIAYSGLLLLATRWAALKRGQPRPLRRPISG